MTDPSHATRLRQRVLLLTAGASDGTSPADILDAAGIDHRLCGDMDEICREANAGAGALLLAEEHLGRHDLRILSEFLALQEEWSDLPVFLLADGIRPDGSAHDNPCGESLNLTFLQHPLQELTLVSCVRTALRARQRQYATREFLSQRAAVLASINDSFMMVDRDWRFIYVNQKAADMYHLPREELLGRVKWEALPDLDEDYRQRLETAAVEQRELQVEVYHSSSARWFEQRLYPSSGGVSIFATDVTERKKAEADLRYQLGITRAITDNAAESLFLLDSEGRVTFMNPAAEQSFGWKKQELMGQVLHDHVHVHRSRSSREECPLHSVLTSGLTLRDLEDEFRCKDGSRLYVSCSNAAISIDGKVTGAVLVVHDITYHKLAEQQLKALNENLEMRVAERTAVAEQRASQLSALASELTQAEQRERRRLAHILHDNLQQILVATKLQVGTVRQRMSDAGLRQSLEQVESLLTRSVDESRSLTVELSPPILYDAGLCRALEWLARRMSQEHDLTVTLDTDPVAEPPGDDIRAFLFQAVRESLFNIVKHAQVREASVRMFLVEGTTACIEVRDQGVGFDLQAGEAKEIGSGGFGLFSIRERLEFLGGRMVITSAPGEGSAVSLFMPIRQAVTAPAKGGLSETVGEEAPAPRPTPAARGTGNVIRVLLADDHKMLRDGLAGLLRDQPDIDVVSEASNGEMAVDLARQTQPDVVIMDVSMPKMNGVEATRCIASELPHIKVIGLSMHEKEDMDKAMREAGAVNYVTKGAPSEILTAAIRNCMRTGNSSDEPPAAGRGEPGEIEAPARS